MIYKSDYTDRIKTYQLLTEIICSYYCIFIFYLSYK